MEGDGGSRFLGMTATSGQGIFNDEGTINNVGVVEGDSSWGEIGDMTGYLTLPYGIYNVAGAINDYCDTPLTDSSYGGTAPNPISCATVVFYVEGEGVTGAIVGGERCQERMCISPCPGGPSSFRGRMVNGKRRVFPHEQQHDYHLDSVYELIPATESFTYSFPSHLICTTHPWPASVM